jgi:hypothetical protein
MHIAIAEKTKNFFASFTINNAITKMLEAIYQKPEARGFYFPQFIGNFH